MAGALTYTAGAASGGLEIDRNLMGLVMACPQVLHSNLPI